jgi:hypothetical protein
LSLFPVSSVTASAVTVLSATVSSDMACLSGGSGSYP